ncbi:MAG: helix-turn-helix domain-containing protein [Bryobacterales bacterium]|nr:helix-turn-helix domain-containing protein [Bryobacterales bacterium]
MLVAHSKAKALESILPLLVHIQAKLDSDLSLDALAAKAGLSRFHLHRLFRQTTGETAKAYILRLRLQQAAFRLMLHDDRVIDIALECGFSNHASFSRAFRDHYGVAPSQYRADARTPVVRSTSSPRAPDLSGQPSERAALRIVHLRAMHLAFIRHVGPYESVDPTLWAQLENWAKRRGLAHQLLIGIGHDPPSSTPSHLLRFDAAIDVPGPFATEGRIGYQRLEGGTHASTTHVGPYAALPETYEAVFGELLRLKQYKVIGLPAIEIYQATAINPDYGLNHTALYFPLRAAENRGRRRS